MARTFWRMAHNCMMVNVIANLAGLIHMLKSENQIDGTTR